MGVPSELKRRQSRILWDLCGPPCFLHRAQYFLEKVTDLCFLGDSRVGRLHFALFPRPFHFIPAGRLCIQFCIVLNLLKNRQEGSGTDRSCLLHEVILCLLLGWTHTQQMSREVRVVQGLDYLGCLVRACAEIQAWEIVKVAIELLDSHQKLTNRSPVGLPQRVCDVILQVSPASFLNTC
jgi:hypothetical protein